MRCCAIGFTESHQSQTGVYHSNRYGYAKFRAFINSDIDRLKSSFTRYCSNFVIVHLAFPTNK